MRESFLPGRLVIALAVLGIVLTATVVPGLFTIDEDNYLVNIVALRQGSVSLRQTAGLTPSNELAFFDPAVDMRAVSSTPVGSTAPPLYGPIALPFSYLGWRGLVLINTLAFLLTIALVFRHTRRYASEGASAWLAAGTFAVAGFTLEYAQGVWPHCLSIALCTGGILLIGRWLDHGRLWHVAAAGALLAAATGIRYQNAAIAALMPVAMVLWAPRRWRGLVAYGGAAAPLVVASALINQGRLGSLNPISKGPGYLSMPVVESGGRAFEPLVMFWARLVDFSVRPPLIGPLLGWVKYEPESGAHLIFGATVQKAFLQSAPWAVLALILFAVAWFSRWQMPPARRRQIQLFALVSAAMLAIFAISGRARHEGASYNQRYLLELVPLAAITFGWALDAVRLRYQTVLAGLLWGALVATATLVVIPPGVLQHVLILKLPLLMATALAVCWWMARTRPAAMQACALTTGLAIGWAAGLHLLDDVSASRTVRGIRLEQTNTLRQVIPDNSALFAYWGYKDAAGPLLLERNVVILDVHADDGKAAPALARELLARGRRVFVLQSQMPKPLLDRLVEGLKLQLNPNRGGTFELRSDAD